MPKQNIESVKNNCNIKTFPTELKKAFPDLQYPRIKKELIGTFQRTICRNYSPTLFSTSIDSERASFVAWRQKGQQIVKLCSHTQSELTEVIHEEMPLVLRISQGKGDIAAQDLLSTFLWDWSLQNLQKLCFNLAKKGGDKSKVEVEIWNEGPPQKSKFCPYSNHTNSKSKFHPLYLSEYGNKKAQTAWLDKVNYLKEKVSIMHNLWK